MNTRILEIIDNGPLEQYTIQQLYDLFQPTCQLQLANMLTELVANGKLNRLVSVIVDGETIMMCQSITEIPNRLPNVLHNDFIDILPDHIVVSYHKIRG